MATPSVLGTHKMLGEVLTESGKLSADELERVLELQQKNPERLGKLLVDLGALAERDLLAALSQLFQLPIVAASQFPPLPPELPGLSPRFMRTSKFCPFDLCEGRLSVAVVDPLDHETLESIRLATGYRVLVFLASETEIIDAIEKFFGTGTSSFARLVESYAESDAAEIAETEDAEHLRDLALEAPVIRVVNMLITRAVESRGSDIHIEPMEKELRIRFRIDGIMYPVESPPRQMSAAVVSRVKLMAKLNIAERRLPQDGRIRIKVLGKEIDLRVSTLPTIHGESVVMRILDRSDMGLLDLEKLGYPPQVLKRMQKITARPHGILLVTGPTGSGKSTTLYASLGQINQTDKKIITLEDPIEYQMKGVNQVQVNQQIGLTFAEGLRHIVRQDPDVIMVGEIRDFETAEIAIRAALTGHLVFSTLHTNDAPSAITRLCDMGVPNYLLSSSILAVLAQRLVRVLCPGCKRPVEKQVSMFAGERVLVESGSPTFPAFEPVGCDACRQIGFRSRIGIFELMEINEDLQRLIVRTSEANVLRQAAEQNGMKTLRDDGWLKVLSGTTAVEEVLRVTQESI